MHHPKSVQSKWFRSGMVPAALVCVMLSACADQQPAGPMSSPRVARDYNATSDLSAVDEGDVPFNKFFVAWSRTHSANPIQTQIFALDTRQNRQYGGWWPDESVLSFARANPGRLYINGDEPDQYCIAPAEYAEMYNHFVEAVRGADATARFSPAGFAEPNEKCCPPDDEACQSRSHSLGYANQFYDAYVARYGQAPPVDEWRFHHFGLTVPVGDVAGWWARVDEAATWSVAHGGKMVLGAWAFHRWREPDSDYQEHMKQAIGRLMRDSRITEAAYWSYESWAGEAHYLANSDGSLTAQGQTYANPLTDVPTGIAAVGGSNGRARLRWSNTTAAWEAEVEYWVKAPGSSSFVYHSTERVAGAGATQTPLDIFHIGDSVMGRVRYYNRFGQAAWSGFSNAVLMVLGENESNKGNGSRRPRFCNLPTSLQSQRCD